MRHPMAMAEMREAGQENFLKDSTPAWMKLDHVAARSAISWHFWHLEEP